MVKPGGLMIAATLNRTMKSFALAIVGAEYILRWLPRGTHQWDKFVTPDELEAAIEAGGLDVIGERGVIYNLLADRWQLSSDMDVNYMVAAMRKTTSTARAKPVKKAAGKKTTKPTKKPAKKATAPKAKAK
jgi:2-polyprenyl-6-hydroxyphenyl methylase/3-demethylubiquinone-9 3-methyltransferase